ncbi:MAG: hypothetical protein OXI24_15345, partial [Candidatus Poribacteria bacterium]|nr:hypothetical protein [Candidatus Poribacteria bacterium]
MAFPVGEDFWIKHAVNFVWCKDFIEENFFAFFFFPRLTTLQDAILVGPNKCNFTAFTEKFLINVQTDFVTKLGIGVGKEVFVGDILNEGI